MIPRLRPPYMLSELFEAFISPAPDERERIERAFASNFGFPFALAFAYGRAGFFALLKSLELQQREIVLPAYTCVVMPHAVSLSGNVTRFVDCQADHFNVASDAMVDHCSRETAMVVPTPVFGYPLDMENTIRDIRKKASDAFVLLDAAQGFGITDPHATPYAHVDAMLVGLGIGKMISTLTGGILLLRDCSLYERLKEFRNRHAESNSRVKSTCSFLYACATWLAFRNPAIRVCDFLENDTSLLWRFTDKFYGKDGITLPADLHALRPQACWKLGRYQLARLEHIVAKRRQHSERYCDRLAREGFPVFHALATPSYSCFPFVVANRDAVAAAMRQYGVQLGILIDYACSDLPGYEESAGTCPHATYYGNHMVNLPNFPDLSPRQVDTVVDHLCRLRQRHPQWFVSSVTVPHAHRN